MPPRCAHRGAARTFIGNYGPLLLRKGQLRQDPMLLYHLAYCLLCVLAVFVNTFFHAPLLFDVVVRDETLRNVIRSVTRNGKSIFMTAVFGLMIIYLFSVVAFLFLRDDFVLEVNDEFERSCDSLLMCIVTTLNHVRGRKRAGALPAAGAHPLRVRVGRAFEMAAASAMC